MHYSVQLKELNRNVPIVIVQNLGVPYNPYSQVPNFQTVNQQRYYGNQFDGQPYRQGNPEKEGNIGMQGRNEIEEGTIMNGRKEIHGGQVIPGMQGVQEVLGMQGRQGAT